MLCAIDLPISALRKKTSFRRMSLTHLGHWDIGALAPGMGANFFSIDLNTVDYDGALNDPVAATVYRAPQKARYTVINGRVVVENGQVTTVDMAPVIEAHNRFSRELLTSPQLTRLP